MSVSRPEAAASDHAERRPAGPGFTVAATVLSDAAGRVLVVRKHGTRFFMLPGGKVEPGESPDATARREVAEELGLALEPELLRPVGEFLTDAANEPGHWLASAVFVYDEPIGDVSVRAEIAEARWVDPLLPEDDWAPLNAVAFAALGRS